MKQKSQRVQRCRFVHYEPATVNAIEITPPTVKHTQVAVGRGNGDIEIWQPAKQDDERDRYVLMKTIPGGKGLSIECLAWSHQSTIDHDDDDDPAEIEAQLQRQLDQPPRLFSSGMNHAITEWDLASMTIKRSVDANGGVIMCLAVNPKGTLLAAGCEDGTIRLFDISHGDIVYQRSFEAQKRRILSMAWSPHDDYIVSGGEDSAVCLWNIDMGRVVHRMTVDKKKGEHTFVWAVLALENHTVVSGDSLGHLTFWDARTGACHTKILAHEADILALTATRDGNCVVSAGVDRRLVVSANVPEKTQRRWIKKVDYRNHHNHDIRALAMVGQSSHSTILSGGVDTELVATVLNPQSRLKKWHVLPIFPQKYPIAYSASQNLLMATFPTALSLWHMPGTNEKPSNTMEIDPSYEYALHVELRPANFLTSTAMSTDAEWVAVADTESVRLFRMDTKDGCVKMHKVRSFEQALQRYLGDHGAAPGAHHVLFTPGSDRLVVVTVESRILIVDLRAWTQDVFEVLCEFGHHRQSERDDQVYTTSVSIVALAVSADGQWLCTGDDSDTLHVFNLDSLKHHMVLARPSARLTVLAFNPVRPQELCIVLGTNELIFYDVEQQQLTEWTKTFANDMKHQSLCRVDDAVRGIMYSPDKDDMVYLYGSRFLYRVQTKMPTPDRKRDAEGEVRSFHKVSVSSLSRYEQLLFACFTAANHLLLVEQPKKSVLESLPPTFKVKSYGR